MERGMTWHWIYVCITQSRVQLAINKMWQSPWRTLKLTSRMQLAVIQLTSRSPNGAAIHLPPRPHLLRPPILLPPHHTSQIQKRMFCSACAAMALRVCGGGGFARWQQRCDWTAKAALQLDGSGGVASRLWQRRGIQTASAWRLPPGVQVSTWSP
jgi:hypothetical protein